MNLQPILVMLCKLDTESLQGFYGAKWQLKAKRAIVCMCRGLLLVNVGHCLDKKLRPLTRVVLALVHCGLSQIPDYYSLVYRESA